MVLQVKAQSVDSTAVAQSDSVRHLGEVVITEHRNDQTTRSTVPLQQLTKESLATLNVLQVSDAVKHFSGVTVKDYGGIGGLKSVSVRSLGASHTAVAYDGLVLSDAQNGQVDIGRFSLENVDMISLSSGQSDKIFQTARQMGSAAVLNINTLYPQFDSIPFHGHLSLRGGSWWLVNPNIYLAYKINSKLALTASAEWLYCKGNYPYTLYYGQEGDSTSLERRQNTDVQNARAEASLYGRDSIQSGYLKFYYYQSERGLPGATIFYNTSSFSNQRIFDRTIFVQGHFERAVHKEVDLQLNAKYNYSYTHYVDPSYLNSVGREENRYYQNEYYLNAAVQWRAFDGFSAVLTTDGIVSMLNSDLPNFVVPTRYQWLMGAAVKYVNNWVTASATVLTTASAESLANGERSSQRYFRASPYASLSFKPFEKVNLRIRAFYKNIFRLPTFNDLYYGRIGNANLKPETTNQYNIGITYQFSYGDILPLISITCDAYHNSVKDKIVAYPTKNIYTWTMLNYGRVSITGFDFSGELVVAPLSWMSINLAASYTYDRALNVTNKADADYKHQIPYTPRISGSGRAAIKMKNFTIAWSLIWCGHRYVGAQNYAENRLDGYFDHSLSASYDLKIKRHILSLNAECLNVANENYAVVRYFPMPGRSYRVTLKWSF